MVSNLSGKSLDRRVERTRAALEAALFELIQQHDWPDLSVSRLCRTAGVARSSFYIHYTDLADLLDAMIAANLARALGQRATDASLFDWLIDHVAGNRQLFYRTATPARGSFVLARFKAGVSLALAQSYDRRRIPMSPIHQAMLVGSCFEALAVWAKRWNRAELATIKSDVRRIEKTLLGQRDDTQPQAR
jgi:AcrR family transcriptional regulator